MGNSKKTLRHTHACWVLEQTTFLPRLPTLAGSACINAPTRADPSPHYTLPNAPDAALNGGQQGMSPVEMVIAHRKEIFEVEGREFPMKLKGEGVAYVIIM